MMIAAGYRQIKQDASGDDYVIFDKGTYKIPKNAKIIEHEGEDSVSCEAHVDPDTSSGYALIGGVRMELAYNPENEDNDDDR